jgi:Rrf2 family protein
MKLSTKGRYGVRLMLDLAIHHGDGPVLLRDIAKRQGISEKYLWNLIHPLKTLGLVNSIRGAHGGYVLAKDPSEINLKDILIALEGSLCFVDCVDKPSLCKRSFSCIFRDVWCGVSNDFLQTLENITLEKMIKNYRSKNAEIVTCNA